MAAAADASEDPGGPEPEDAGEGGEEPEIYDFTEDSGYSVGDLEPAYEILEGSYWIDEENENVVVADSSWNQVEEMLEADQEEESSDSSWKEKISGYLLDHDSAYMKAGLGGMGTGLLSSGLGYATAADFLFTGGAMSFGWGLGGVIGDYLFGEEEEEVEAKAAEDPDSELHEYSDWDVEVVDLQAYGQAVREYED